MLSRPIKHIGYTTMSHVELHLTNPWTLMILSINSGLGQKLPHASVLLRLLMFSSYVIVKWGCTNVARQQPHCPDIVMMCYDMALALFGHLWKSDDPQTQMSNIHIGSFGTSTKNINLGNEKFNQQLVRHFPCASLDAACVSGGFIYAPLDLNFKVFGVGKKRQ